MPRLIISLFCLLLLFITPTWSQNALADQTDTSVLVPTKQISLLTCGVGSELYSSFGHSAIRVLDKKNNRDIVYNYGTFDNFESQFYLKFTLGKLNYFLAKNQYNDFLWSYQQEGRSVREQILDISEEDANKLYHFLEYNVLPQNRSYKYDFIFDNCATRIRDVLENSLGTSFQYSNVIGDKEVSFRNVINEYLANSHWSRLGINILLGSKIDSLMTNRSAMFLPDVLHDALAGAKLSSMSIVQPSKTLLEGSVFPSTPNYALFLGIGILVIAMLVFNIRKMSALKTVFIRFVLIVMGILGSLILFMWLVTDHQACSDNYNILWAVPTHLIVAFLPWKGRPWLRLYALASISLLVVAFLVHIVGIQVMPLIELLPWFVILMLIYADFYKQGAGVAPSKEA